MMKTKKFFRTLFFVYGVFTLFGCRELVIDEIGQLRKAISLSTGELSENSDFLLQKEGIKIGIDREYREKMTNKKNVVMVILPFREILLLASLDSFLLQKIQIPNTSRFLLLYSLTSTQQQALAIQLHKNHDSFPCGRLEGISLSDTSYALKLDDPVEPIFLEFVKLSPVTQMLDDVKTSRIQSTITMLEDRVTRHHSTTSGQGTPSALRDRILGLIGDSLPNLETELYSHDSTDQNSLIVSFPGTKDDATTVVFGAHLDSIVGSISSTDQDEAPGADDDASGVAALVEAIQVLAKHGAKFERRVEFQFYAAEEMGLWGSGEIAADYRKKGRKIAAMFQLDMVAYSKNPKTKTIYLAENDTSTTLRRSTKDILNLYLDGDYAEGTIVDGTSDHRSFHSRGYNAVFPFEHPTEYNHAIHSLADTSENINNMPLAGRFTQLALAFASHHAGLKSARKEYDQKVETGAAVTASDDIKLGFVKGTLKNTYHAIAAGPEDSTRTIEFCKLAKETDLYCSNQLTSMKSVLQRTGRAFHAEKYASQYSDNDIIRFFTYNSKDKIVAKRTIRLNQK